MALSMDTVAPGSFLLWLFEVRSAVALVMRWQSGELDVCTATLYMGVCGKMPTHRQERKEH